MSNGEVGVDLEHVLFMPMEPLQSLNHLNFPIVKQNKNSALFYIYIFVFNKMVSQ